MAVQSDVEYFARLVDALEPWLDQVVIIGGWAHRLYRLHPLAQPLDYEPLGTFDTDIAVPLDLPATGEQIRARLLERDFREELMGDMQPPAVHYRVESGDNSFYAEFLTPLEGSAVKRGGTDVNLSSMSVASTYTDRARQATTYRKGRVLLAGDAAHVHSPLGGQGLNTGIGDAMNLGWKLAATIKGWAPDDLLDTYTCERHPIGAWALDWTRVQVAIMRPDPHARAIAAVIRDLMQTQDATTYFVGKMSGLLTRYNFGGDHPLVGCSAPDFEFEDGNRLGNLLHEGKGQARACGTFYDSLPLVSGQEKRDSPKGGSKDEKKIKVSRHVLAQKKERCLPALSLL